MNVSGKNQVPCGSLRSPCSSILFTINNVSNHNDTICLSASPIKQIRYTVENTIIIKHSLTVTKFPVYSQNPLITYDLNVASNRKEFYAFAISRYALAPKILNLNIKSVNFNVNILTTFSDGFKALQKNVVARDISDFHLCLSISDSVVSSTSHAVNFSDESEYENLTIHMKHLIIKSGDFIFKNKRDRCEPSEHIKDIIEMYNVTICNTGNVTLSVHGCFNMSIEKLTCSDFTWKKQEMFTFTGGVLYTKNVLIKNILANNNIKYTISETKPLFFIKESYAKIQNTLIEESVGMSRIRAKRFSAMIIVQHSIVQILDTKMVRNSFRNFALANKSSLCFKNMTFIENNLSATLCRAEESNVTLHGIKFQRNKIGCLVSINLNSKVLITGNSLTENVIFKNIYSVSRSFMKIDNTNFRWNQIKNLMLEKSQSHIDIDNVTFTNNTASFCFFNISGKSKLGMHNALFLQNSRFGENRFRRPSCFLNVQSNSRAIIQNNTLIENDFFWRIYRIAKNSSIQLNHVAFTRNRYAKIFFYIESNSRAIIQNNTLIENYFWVAYLIVKNSSIQINHVVFTRNRFSIYYLFMKSNSSTIIQNNTLIENNLIYEAYRVRDDSRIQLINVTFIRNNLPGNLLYLVSNSGAKLINNRMVRNRFHRMFLAQSSDLEIDTIFIKNNTFFQLIRVVKCRVSFELMKIQENNVEHDMIYAENSAGRITHNYIENSNKFKVSAFRTRCMYSRNSNFAFEITNTEIIWSSEVLVLARPIIQLCGSVFLSNVKLLVTSLFGTEILKYSNKDLLWSEYGGNFKNMPVNYKFSSLFIRCTKASVKHIAKSDTFLCIPCTRGTYALNNESLNTSISFQSKSYRTSKKITKHESTNFTCLDCPAGASCTTSIKSRNNFYGYKTKKQKLKFLPCPRGFCCTGNQCHTIDSCNKNRVGTLCGRCIESYVESYLSTDCISIHSCQNFAKFWLVYCISALTFLYYMKDFITLIKTTVSNFSKIFKLCKKEKECDDEIDITIGVVGSEEHSEKTSHITVSGIFALIVSFYQIKQLMNVNVQYKKSSDFYFITFITDCFNLEMVAVAFSSLCSMSNLDAVSKVFIKAYLLTAALIIICSINYFMSTVFHFFRSSLGRLSSLKPSDRFGVCLIRVLMLSYKNMASVSLLLLNCIEVADNKVLFIKGDMKCYQWWQIVIAVFFFTWILLFPLSLKVSFNMFMKDKISFAKFILCLIVPFAVVTNYRLNRNVVSVDLQKSRNTYKVKEILREIFQESYRLKTDDPSGETVFYETWRLYQRVLLAVVATFWIDPLHRITLMTPIAILIAISYYVIKPYKPEMYILHWI